MVRVFGQEVAWSVPERSLGVASLLEELASATEKYESWRYSPIDNVAVSSFATSAPSGFGTGATRALAALGLVDRDVVEVGPRGLVRVSAAEGVSVRTELAGGEVVELAEEPYAALASLLAPERIAIEVTGAGDPLVVVVGADGEAAAGFAWVRLRLGAPREVWLLDGAGTGTLLSALVDVEVNERVGAVLHHVPIGAPRAVRFLELQASVAAEGELLVAEAAAEQGYHRTRLDVRLIGERASTRVRSAFVAGTGETQEFRTFVVHEAPRSRSDLLYKGAVLGSGTSIYSGLITIAPGGRGSDAFQTNRNLLLSAEARAESVPNLDIQVSDVRCSHASTVGPIDEELVFALTAKGIDPKQAERMLADGFFADIADLTEAERHVVRRALEDRWQL